MYKLKKVNLKIIIFRETGHISQTTIKNFLVYANFVEPMQILTRDKLEQIGIMFFHQISGKFPNRTEKSPILIFGGNGALRDRKSKKISIKIYLKISLKI